jgi:hypothetical protein
MGHFLLNLILKIMIYSFLIVHILGLLLHVIVDGVGKVRLTLLDMGLNEFKGR